MAPWELDPGQLADIVQLARLDAPALVSISGAVIRGPGTVYLLHFDRPYKHARHYCGWAPPGGLERRLRLHATGRSDVVLMRALFRAGIGFTLARTWKGSRQRERQIKGQPRGSAHLPRSCLLCHPDMKVRTK